MAEPGVISESPKRHHALLGIADADHEVAPPAKERPLGEADPAAVTGLKSERHKPLYRSVLP
jgi:hypothetical protein